MLGQRQSVDTTFEQPTTIAPSEQQSAAQASPITQTPPMLNDSRAIQPTSSMINLAQPMRIGEAHQPNRLLEILLVGLQFVSLIVIAVAFFPALLWQSTALQIVGSTVLAIGLAVGIWAVMSFHQKISVLPSPGPGGFLVTGGPYVFVRHPMYLALLLVSVGLFLAYPTLPRLAAIVVLAGVLFIKMRYEEHMLAERYSGYDTYKSYTGRLLPRFSKKQVNFDTNSPEKRQ